MNTMMILALFGCPEEGKDDSGTATTTTTTTPDPAAVTDLTIDCAKDDSSVTFTAATTGAADEAILNFSDFANTPPGAEEHLFTFDASGNIEDLVLAIPGDTIFTCPAHFAEASAVMSYTVRLYDQGALVDCAAGSESGDAQAFVDDVVKNMTTGFTDTDDFASCMADLTLSY